jgi:hypothetical protein
MVDTMDVRREAGRIPCPTGLLTRHRHRRVAGPPGGAVPGRPRGRRCVRA